MRSMCRSQVFFLGYENVEIGAARGDCFVLRSGVRTEGGQAYDSVDKRSGLFRT